MKLETPALDRLTDQVIARVRELIPAHEYPFQYSEQTVSSELAEFLRRGQRASVHIAINRLLSICLIGEGFERVQKMEGVTAEANIARSLIDELRHIIEYLENSVGGVIVDQLEKYNDAELAAIFLEFYHTDDEDLAADDPRNALDYNDDNWPPQTQGDSPRSYLRHLILDVVFARLIKRQGRELILALASDETGET